MPTTCLGADELVGCCVVNELYYCDPSTNKISKQKCSGGNVCTWDVNNLDYECEPGPVASDPSGTSPIACQ